MRPVMAGVLLLLAAGCSNPVAPETDASVTLPSVPLASAPPATSAADATTSPTTPRVTATAAPPTAAPTTAAATTTDVAAAERACAARIPTGTLVAQLVWPAVYGADLASAQTQLADWGVGGAVVMTAPPADITARLAALKQAGAVPLLLATDEEGGQVQRFTSLGALPAPATIAATMTPEAARDLVAEHAAAVAAAGIDIVFAPVVDVQPVDGSGPIGDRSFGSDPVVVAAYAAAYVDAWEQAGVMPVLKHFPGHGDASGDTHEVLAVAPPLDELRARDLVPYRELSGTGAAVMAGHLVVPGLTADGVPASLSREAITDLLRGEYGYRDALVFTDALGMSAIAATFTIPEAAERAIAAGADVAIFTATDQTPRVIERLADAVTTGRVDDLRVEDAVTRVLARKGLDMCAFAALVGDE